MPQFRKIAKTIVPTRFQVAVGQTRSLVQLAWHSLRLDFFGQIFPPKPTAISMMANDVCNSRCQMCLIWEQKKDRDITPDELRQVLAEPLFKNVRHIGVTGGEPTLRRDLSELFRVLTQKRPKIHGASIITNAIRQEDVQSRVLACARICQEHDIGFDVMVSLDGVGDVHDRVRGRPGNFNAAIACMERFRSEGISVLFGATITRSNAEFVDELLDYAQDHGWYGRFRVAEFIDRLYNASQKEFIRNFEALVQYHLGLFFYRLEHGFEDNPMYQKTYRSIRGMLVEGRSRTTGCPYHHSAVILTSRGDLLYCSPKSPILGNILNPGSASAVFFGNLDKRKEIREKDCDNCIHDYHVPVTFREKVGFYLKHRRRSREYDCEKLAAEAAKLPVNGNELKCSRRAKLESKRVLIVGWYGTETAGDKAILWSICKRLVTRTHAPSNIYVSSLHPFITEWTKREMDLPYLQVIPTFETEFEQVSRSADEIVVGGGPLMDLEILNHILYAFLRGAERDAILRVEGCGIGPLKNPRYLRVVAQILRLADIIDLRDPESVERCKRQFDRDAKLVDDPAMDYVFSVRKSLVADVASESFPHSRHNYVAGFFRDWGAEYAEGLPHTQFAERKAMFDQAIEKFLADLARKGLKIHLMPMHSFYVGGDDRIYNRQIFRNLTRQGISAGQVTFARLPASPFEILSTMYHARISICMRYHSVVFAEALDRPYLAVDYTGGGKIHSFLQSRGKLDRLLTIDDVIGGKAQRRLDSCLDELSALQDANAHH